MDGIDKPEALPRGVMFGCRPSILARKPAREWGDSVFLGSIPSIPSIPSILRLIMRTLCSGSRRLAALGRGFAEVKINHQWQVVRGFAGQAVMNHAGVLHLDSTTVKGFVQ